MHSEKRPFHKYEIAIMMGLIILGLIMVIGSIIGIELRRKHITNVTITTLTVSPIPTPNTPAIPSTLLDMNKPIIPELISSQAHNSQSPHYYTLGFYGGNIIIVIKHFSHNLFDAC